MELDSVIHKGPADLTVTPNFTDYDATRAAFTWSQIPDLCAGMTGCNIAYAAVDRHAQGPEAGKTALRFISDTPDLATRDVSYAELGRLTSRFTNVQWRPTCHRPRTPRQRHCRRYHRCRTD